MHTNGGTNSFLLTTGKQVYKPIKQLHSNNRTHVQLCSNTLTTSHSNQASFCSYTLKFSWLWSSVMFSLGWRSLQRSWSADCEVREHQLCSPSTLLTFRLCLWHCLCLGGSFGVGQPSSDWSVLSMRRDNL